MVRPSESRPPARKARKRKSSAKRKARSWRRLATALTLLGLLLFTVGAVSYVIFFRTVLA